MPTSEESLDQHQDKPARGYLVVEVFRSDENGAEVECYREYGLRDFDPPVRIFITESTKLGEALFFLSEASKALEDQVTG